ncbi:hypothetical protein F5Y05DRAFT_151096 [Hypoxylon sp. FL0543]|nr:hypothetical protein F5Y05DRAFT_151096 [Hypoxylon sp. FL0543]
MAHWEASRSPPRHSTHHHRRNNQPRDENSSHDVSDNKSRPKHPHKQHKGGSTIVKSNSASQPQIRYDIVENWLEQTARQDPLSWPSMSQGHRKFAGNSCPSGPLNATSPYNKHPTRVDPRWSPRHGLPRGRLRSSASPFRDLGPEDQRKSTRRHAAPSDDSVINGFEISTKPPDYRTGPIRRDRENFPPPRLSRKPRLASMYASSTTSHVDKEVSYEKRPRHKTRKDKYETKEKKRKHQQEGHPSHDDHRCKKRRRAEKRKTMISGKNVMNNFRSDAVLNDRITVQPHLKPGIFDNGRTSKRQPISDLAFSEMQFLKYQKRETQPKPLSKSRQRDKQREGREIEEVSSFFLPHAANGNTPKSVTRSARRSHRNNHRDLRHREHLPYNTVQEVPEAPLSDHCPNSERGHLSQQCEETTEAPSLHIHGSINDEKESGQNTTYFTWSSSRQSPRLSREENGGSPNVSGSVWTTTPEPIRRDLIATGIYRNTGIPLYDECLSEQHMERRMFEMKNPSIHRTDLEDSVHGTHHKSNKPLKVIYRDQAVMTEDHPTILEPHLDTRVAGEHQAPSSQKEPNTQLPFVPQGLNRQQVAKHVRLTPIERGGSRQNIRASNVLSTEAVATCQSPTPVDTGVGRDPVGQTRGTPDQASMTSRDAMPPPPIPNGRYSSHAMEHDGTDVDPFPQNVPATYTAAEVPEACHTASCTKDAPETLEHPNCSSQTTLPYEPTTNINTASWIPQRTPSARNTERQTPLSRPSTRTAIYIDQYERKSSGGLHHRHQIESQMPESMADFIARIESDSQLRPAPHDCIIPGPESGIRDAALDDASFDTYILQDQFSATNWEEKSFPNVVSDPHVPDPNPGSSRAVQQYDEFYIETQCPEYGIGIPRGLPEIRPPLEDFEEERFEMSNFWRPNQFSQF